ncbi:MULTISPECIES: hypothetical protein [unclassified Variovorax]|uniref:hypothetical protein n=1 Tax=unclassified Variovorax TaxID=663243 RepID=UPI00076CAC4E|nr:MULTISPECIES: hypothetical protein [unclassified Variovorax]KWT65017.1 hypothetical protein APY03_7470 [Variovorax sp. WDL1]PNG49115.1 hypothetical protein CHC06_06352 [Variovorax sp. B2]PNG49500.1 hypothetical protein CHC07_06409 [Variovorax sp. B4]VTV18867.1 hypothetical protein WDL1P2_00488 [Variovorax sp. WDL1]
MKTSSIRDAELGAPYIPSSIGLPPEIEALAWRKRTIHVFRDPQEQFLVLAPDHIYKRYGHRVLGSGPTEAHAATSAAIGLAYHAQQPSDFCPSLRGYSFEPSASATSSLVVWNCVDADGNAKGQANGKREAAEDALFAFLAARPVSELSADEFANVATSVQVKAGFGRRDKAMLLADDSAGFRRAIAQMYRHAPAMVNEGETLQAFRARVQSSLQDGKIGDSQVLYLPIRDASGESPVVFHLVFHTASVSSASAIRGVYEIEHARQLDELDDEQSFAETIAPRC